MAYEMVRFPDGKLIARLAWDRDNNKPVVETDDPNIHQIIVDTLAKPAVVKVPEGDGYAYDVQQGTGGSFAANLRKIKIPGVIWTTPNALEYLLTHQDGAAFQGLMKDHPELADLVPRPEEVPRLIQWLRSL